MNVFEQRDLQERIDEAIRQGRATVTVTENVGSGSNYLRGKLTKFEPGRITYEEVEHAQGFKVIDGEIDQEWKTQEGPFHASFDSTRPLSEDSRTPGRFKFTIPHIGEGYIILETE